MRLRHSIPVPLGSIPELPGYSCGEIKASEGEQTVSGKCWLDSTRSGSSTVAYCVMKTEGEGRVQYHLTKKDKNKRR